MIFPLIYDARVLNYDELVELSNDLEQHEDMLSSHLYRQLRQNLQWQIRHAKWSRDRIDEERWTQVCLAMDRGKLDQDSACKSVSKQSEGQPWKGSPTQMLRSYRRVQKWDKTPDSVYGFIIEHHPRLSQAPTNREGRRTIQSQICSTIICDSVLQISGFR